MAAGVATWLPQRLVATGRLPLFCFFVGMVLGFGFIRFSVRMIRANVRWWPGNVTPGGLHVHHMVFGVAFMILFGVVGLVVPDGLIGWRAVAAGGFGIGAALVLDEFALILHLEDVYWSEQGRRRRGPRKQDRAQRREARLRQPVVRAKIWFQDLVAGAPDRPRG